MGKKRGVAKRLNNSNKGKLNNSRKGKKPKSRKIKPAEHYVEWWLRDLPEDNKNIELYVVRDNGLLKKGCKKKRVPYSIYISYPLAVRHESVPRGYTTVMRGFETVGETAAFIQNRFSKAKLYFAGDRREHKEFFEALIPGYELDLTSKVEADVVDLKVNKWPVDDPGLEFFVQETNNLMAPYLVTLSSDKSLGKETRPFESIDAVARHWLHYFPSSKCYFAVDVEDYRAFHAETRRLQEE